MFKFLQKTPTTIRARLFGLTFVTILPLMIFSFLTMVYFQSQQMTIAKRGVRNTVTALSTSLDQKLKDLVSLMKIAGTSAPRLEADALKNFLSEVEGVTRIELLDSFGEDLPTDFFIRSDPSGRSFTIVLKLVDDTPPRYVRAIFDTGYFSRFLSSQSIEPGWTAAILDDEAMIIARSRNPERHVGRQATKQLAKLQSEKPSGFFEDVNQEGVMSFGYFKRIDTTNWTLVLGAPKDAFLSDLHRSLWTIGAGALLFLMIALLLAHWTSLRISLPLQGLLRFSKSEDGMSADENPEWLTEVNLVYQALVSRNDSVRRSEEHFQLIFDSMPLIAWLSTPATGELLLNKAWTDYTGLSPDRKQIWDIVHPEDAKESQPIISLAIKESKPYVVEHRILRHSDKTYRWHLLRGTPLMDGKGQLLRWVGTATDIDDQKRAGLSLELLAEASRIFSTSLSIDDVLKSVAEVFVPKLGDWCSIDLLTAEGIRKVALVHPDQSMQEKIKEYLKSYPTDPDAPTGAPCVIRTGREEIYEDISDEILRKTTKDEKQYELLKTFGFRSAAVIPITSRNRTLGALTLIYSQEGKKYHDQEVAHLKDLGSRAGIAIENAMLFDEVRRAVEMRDEFLSIASHELNTPLTSLNLQLQLALKSLDTMADSGLIERLEKFLKVSLRQTKRLVSLINELLDVSRISSGKLDYTFEPTDLRSLVIEVGERFSNPALKLDDLEDIEISCDRARMDQVITNLFSNALKYGEDRPVTVSLKTIAGEICLSVKDQGIGIPPEKLGSIFGRFERAVEKNRFSGLGLGLYISQKILEIHGGRIEVESIQGKGSTFTVIMPTNSFS